MNILILKWQQIRRIIKLIPFPYFVIIAIMIFAVGLVIFNQLSQDPNGYFVTGAYTWLLFTYHCQRKDMIFIRSLYQKVYIICLIEYIVISLPFFLLIALSFNFKLIPIAFGGLVIVACWSRIPRVKQISVCYDRLFPNSYEWISGGRKSIIYLSFFYLVSVLVLLKTYMGLFAYLFILLQCSSFYREGESISLLCLPELKPSAYIKEKIKKAILYFHIFSLPFYLLFLISYPSKWWLLIVLSIASSISFIYSICFKYAMYTPNERNIGNGIILSLGILGSIIPFLFPFTVIFGIRHYLSAIKNLKIYLYAYNQ